MAPLSTLAIIASIVMNFNALLQDCAASGCDLRAFSHNVISYGALGRVRSFSSRRAVQPRASDVQCDKAGPSLFGMPVRPAQAKIERPVDNESLSASAQTQRNLDGPLDILKAYGNSLKHIAAGIAISAALFAGVMLELPCMNVLKTMNMLLWGEGRNTCILPNIHNSLSRGKRPT